MTCLFFTTYGAPTAKSSSMITSSSHTKSYWPIPLQPSRPIRELTPHERRRARRLRRSGAGRARSRSRPRGWHPSAVRAASGGGARPYRGSREQRGDHAGRTGDRLHAPRRREARRRDPGGLKGPLGALKGGGWETRPRRSSPGRARFRIQWRRPSSRPAAG